MNEKIDKLIEGCPGYSLSLSNQEKQVWLDAQRAMLEVGYRKPQQLGEGELVSDYVLLRLTCHCEVAQLAKCAAEAQLAHCQTTMVKIDWLFERCPHSEPLTLTTRHECDVCMEELLKLKGAK